MNFVFYVCDTDTDYRTEHTRKMDAGRVIAEHLQKGLKNCIVKKYTEYEGELLTCDSVGLVVPAYRWGMSFAVYSFLQNIRVSSKSYVYVAVVGETLSECSDTNIDIRLLNLDTLRRHFKRKNLGTDKDIYVRCIDLPRSIDYTEMKLNDREPAEISIEKIMSGLLMYNIEKLENYDTRNIKAEAAGFDENNRGNNIYKKDDAASREDDLHTGKNVAKYKINNIYLDENIFEGVKLCRAL